MLCLLMETLGFSLPRLDEIEMTLLLILSPVKHVVCVEFLDGDTWMLLVQCDLPGNAKQERERERRREITPTNVRKEGRSEE